MGHNYTVVLYGKDVGAAKAQVKRWRFTVRTRPTFRVLEYARVAATTDAMATLFDTQPITDVAKRAETPLIVGESFRFAPVNLTVGTTPISLLHTHIRTHAPSPSY